MIRTPVDDAAARPACFGSPSIIDRGCRGCAARKPCCKRLSRGLTVRVLARPRPTGEVPADAPDREVGEVMRHGIDFPLWQRLAGLLCGRAGLSYRFPKQKRPYRAVFVDRAGHRVCMVVRLDRRRVVLHFARVEPATANEIGAVLGRGRRGHDLWTLSRSGDEFDDLLSQVACLMRESYLARTYSVTDGGDQS